MSIAVSHRWSAPSMSKLTPMAYNRGLVFSTYAEMSSKQVRISYPLDNVLMTAAHSDCSESAPVLFCPKQRFRAQRGMAEPSPPIALFRFEYDIQGGCMVHAPLQICQLSPACLGDN